MSADRIRTLGYGLCGVLAALAFIVGEILRGT